MGLQEFLDCMNAGERVIAGSEAHRFMSAASFADRDKIAADKILY